MSEPSNNRSSRYAAGIIVLANFILFAPFLFTTNPVSIGSDIGDLPFFFKPMREYIATQIQQGRFPFWNPYSSSGRPFMADPESQLLYPFTYLFAVLPLHLAFSWNYFLHYLICGFGLFLFGRSLKISPTGAVAAVFIYLFSAPHVLHMYAGHLTMITTLAWTPWLFWSLHRFLMKSEWKFAGLFGLFLALHLLGGFAQYTYMTGWLILAFFISICVREKFYARLPRLIGRLGAGILLGIGIFSPQLGMTLELTHLSTRQVNDFAFTSSYSLTPQNLLTFLMPKYFGWKMSSQLDFDVYLGTSFIWENNCYLGVIAFSLFLVACQGWKEGREKFWIATFLLTFLVALGPLTPLFRLLYEVLPGFSMFRGYAKALTLTCLAFALLAGMGLDRLPSRQINNPAKVIFLSISLVLLGMTAWALVSIDTMPFWKQSMLEKLAGWRITNPPENIVNSFTQVLRNHLSMMTLFSLLATGIYLYKARAKVIQQHMGKLLCALLFFELFTFSKSFLTPLDFTPITVADPLVRPVLDEPVWTRVFHQDSLMANLMIPRKVSSVAGYETLPLMEYGKMVNHFNQTSLHHKNAYLIVRPTKQRMDFLAAKYLLVEKNIKLPFPVEPVGTGQAYTDTLNLYQWPGTSSRYHVSQKVRPYPVDTTEDLNDPDRYGRLVDEIVSLYPDTVFVSADHYRRLSKINSTERIPEKKNEKILQVILEDTNRVVLDVETNNPGMLVVSENYYPGWRSRIDGKETPVFPVNLIMKGVEIPAGKHRIEFEFVPTRFFTYLTLSFTSLVGLLSMICWSSRQSSINTRQ